MMDQMAAPPTPTRTVLPVVTNPPNPTCELFNRDCTIPLGTHEYVQGTSPPSVLYVRACRTILILKFKLGVHVFD